ncbi:MAG: DUF2851 family protein [Candidatus Marinimicrobia bacterium]|nr:DUF2851 family protein [Candidatus Neomarinimicrobiota bacterium]
MPPQHSYARPQDAPPARYFVADSEAALHARWARSAGRTLAAVQGAYEVVHPGRHNGGAGPDFLDAVLRFPDGKLRRGDVEIHFSRSGWRAHGHQLDPRYAAVMAHVVLGGPLQSVATVSGGVPTLRMPVGPSGETRACEEGVRLAGAAIGQGHELLTDLALLRWHSRFNDWRSLAPAARLRLLARRLGPGAGAQRLHENWQKFLSPGDDMQKFLDLTGCGENAEPAAAGGRNQLRRARLLSAVAYRTCVAPAGLPDNGWAAMTQISGQLGHLGYEPPTRQFAVEVAGNWLIPWLAERRGVDGFQQWLALPRGWVYQRVKRLANKVGLPAPANFGQQQGWLEWEQSLCAGSLCQACPLSG